jgi:hypothetical protein
LPESKRATDTLNYLAKRGEREFLPDTPRPKHHIADVRFYLASGIFAGALVVLAVEFFMTWYKVPASASLDALKDTFGAFDTLNAGIFTVLGAVIGFYFGKTSGSE